MSRALFGLCVLSIVLLAGRTTVAQPASSDTPGTKVALLVGVNVYDRRGFAERPLQFAERDVEEMQVELTKLGFRVVLLKGSLKDDDPARATRKNIQEAIDKVLESRKASDVVLLGFAGHGAQLPMLSAKGEPVLSGGGKPLEDAYFCPVDAVKGDPSSLVSLTELLHSLDQRGGINLLLVDASRDNSDPGRRGKSITGNELNGRLPRNTAVLFGCAAGQECRETKEAGGGHGVFFHHVLEGLRGEAANKRGDVTWNTLVMYVQDNVNERSAAWFPEKSRGRTDNFQTPHQITNLTQVPVLARIVATPTEKEFASKSTGMKLALIPAGEFLMGSSAADVKAALAADETLKEDSFKSGQPQHRVRITKPFYLGKYEVTQDEFRKVVGRNPSYFSPVGDGKDKAARLNTDRFPVENVSWFDAVAFCNALSAADGFTPYYGLTGIEREAETQSITAATVSVSGGSGYRLPTEAEWEYACRAGTTTHYHFGSRLNGDKANVNGNYPFGTKTKGNFLERPTPVDDPKYPLNSFGLAQMHGNVYEWCWDGFDETAYDDHQPDNPVVNSSVDRRVLRGGSWGSLARITRSAIRNGYAPGSRLIFFGFRVARTP